MTTIIVRAFLLYMITILAMRAMGKRQLGQFQPYELVVALIIADLIAAPISDVSTPLLHGLLPIAALLIANGAIALICMKSDKARAFISGKPSVIMSKGVVNEKELDKLCLSLSDLLEGVRESGILDPADVGCAIIEADGTITAFPRSTKRPPNNSEMGIDAGYEGVPMALVMDGRIQDNNIKSAHVSTEWLKTTLAKLGCDAKGVYLATLNTQGVLTVQIKGGGVARTEALDAGAIEW